MDWSTVKEVVSKFAPIIGSALGPVGGIAGGIISAALGTDNEPEKILDAIKPDPEAIVKIKTAELEHQTKLVEIAAEREKNALASSTAAFATAAADRSDARNYALKTGDTTARNLAYIYTIGFFATLGCHIGMLVANVDIDPTSSTLLNVLEGILTAMVLGSKEYFFGSSSGDASKSQDLSQIAKG